MTTLRGIHIVDFNRTMNKLSTNRRSILYKATLLIAQWRFSRKVLEELCL